MAVAELASISERRVERLVNPSLSGRPAGVPDRRRRPQLRLHDPAVRRRVARQREQGALPPGSVDSIPTSAGQEDHVSMGNAAGLKAWQVLANAERALAIELLAGAQAVEFLAPLEPGAGVRAAHGRSCGRSRRGSATTARSRATSRRSPARSATARSSRRSRRRWASSRERCATARTRQRRASEAAVPRQRARLRRARGRSSSSSRALTGGEPGPRRGRRRRRLLRRSRPRCDVVARAAATKLQEETAVSVDRHARRRRSRRSAATSRRSARRAAPS